MGLGFGFGVDDPFRYIIFFDQKTMLLQEGLCDLKNLTTLSFSLPSPQSKPSTFVNSV